MNTNTLYISTVQGNWINVYIVKKVCAKAITVGNGRCSCIRDRLRTVNWQHMTWRCIQLTGDTDESDDTTEAVVFTADRVSRWWTEHEEGEHNGRRATG
jgi:hypothetical protein